MCTTYFYTIWTLRKIEHTARKLVLLSKQSVASTNTHFSLHWHRERTSPSIMVRPTRSYAVTCRWSFLKVNADYG